MNKKETTDGYKADDLAGTMGTIKWEIKDYDEVRYLFINTINLSGHIWRLGIGHLNDKAVTFWASKADNFKKAHCTYAKQGDFLNAEGKYWLIIDGKWRLARMNELGDWEFGL